MVASKSTDFLSFQLPKPMFKKPGGDVCVVTGIVCPENDTCPWFWETIQNNLQTGEERIHKECGIRQLPVFLTSVIQASNRPAAEIGAMRTELIGGLTRVVGAMKSDPQAKLLEN